MDLKDLRDNIDNIDNEILTLLNKRAEFVLNVGKIKQEKNMPIWVASREEAIYNRLNDLQNQNNGKFPKEAIRSVFREIISASRLLEEKLVISFLGPIGTFSHFAVLQKFGESVDLQPEHNIPDIFESVEKRNSHFGIVPLANSLEGSISSTLDMFIESNLHIVGEVYVEIAQNLLNKSGNASDIKKIYSHPNPFGQCAKWLKKHFPNAELVPCDSTAAAAKLASEDASIAAIGSKLSEKIYNLKEVASHIEDGKNNFTRFAIISPFEATLPEGSNSTNTKTSIIFSVKDEAGSLYNVLKVFKDNNINLTKLESRPLKQKTWEYLFYTDIEGNIYEEHIKKALSTLEKTLPLTKVLGSYMKA